MPALDQAHRTARLRLVPWDEADAAALRAALDASDGHLRPWIPFMRHEPRTLAQTRDTIARYRDDFNTGRCLRYALWEQASGALVGEAMLIDRAGAGALEVGYWVHVDHTGRGFATEAVACLRALARDALGVTRLTFLCDVRNAPSNAIPARMGAVVDEVVTLEEPDGAVRLNRWVLEGE